MQRSTILIVDDDPAVLASTSKVLRDKYCVKATKSGTQALQIAQGAEPPDLILLDIMMPELSGYEVLAKLLSNRNSKQIPVIFITAKSSEQDEERGLEMGAVDYITKPISPIVLQARVNTHLLLKYAQDYLADKNTFLETEVHRRMEENQQIQNISIRALAHLAETRDPETGQHILRTQSYVNLLARLLSEREEYKTLVTPEYVDLITRSAPLHDIGKVGIPDSVLLKPGKFDDDEWGIMQNHSYLGAQAIELAEKDTNSPLKFLSLAKEIAHWHHERWDGTGYPDKLRGIAIPLSARIMAIADVFDALISRRIYKEAMPLEQAKAVMYEQKGKHFDPDILNVFLENFELFVEIARAHPEQETLL